ncbi:MAG: cytochrome C [Campylobacterota bacterium]|nr:cytochrome C [Campylobacterota bacterium]
MKKIALTTLLVSGLALSAYAMPASYGKCVGCHGAKGERAFGSTPNKVPNKLTKAEVKTALIGYKDGSYGGPQKMLMKGQSLGLSDAQITEIANYIGK